MIKKTILFAILTASWASAAVLDSLPTGYNLQFYDDAGEPGRALHVSGGADFVYPEKVLKATRAERSITWNKQELQVAYDGLKPGVPYVVEIVAAADAGARKASVKAGNLPLIPELTIPASSVVRTYAEIPAEAIQSGKLELTLQKLSGPNVVLSEIALYAPLPERQELSIRLYGGTTGEISGIVTGLLRHPVPSVKIAVSSAGKPLAKAVSGQDGCFTLDGAPWSRFADTTPLLVEAKNGDAVAATQISCARLRAGIPVLRPLPQRVSGIEAPVISLDGEWRAAIQAKAALVTEAKNAKPIHIPGQFAQQGFEVPDDGSAVLTREFTIPAAWRGRRVLLRFNAIHGNCQYTLNGTRIGESTRLFTPVDFEITAQAKFGEQNILSINIALPSVAETLSCSAEYAHHNLLGIDRSVQLAALPNQCLESLHIETDLDKAYHDAKLRIDFVLDGSEPDKDVAVNIDLRKPDGSAVELPQSHFPISTLNKQGERRLLQVPVAAPALWNAEKPTLYQLGISLVSGTTVVERIERSVGFRKIETVGSELRVNGHRVKLFGANRHEIDPLTGRSDTAKWAEQDVRLFKDANVNYIRTSHYPPTEEFLDACDRLGMYVECEGPFCWTNGKGEDDPGLYTTWLDASAAMVEFHRNHASITHWSIANESNLGTNGDLEENYKRLNAWFQQTDSTRPTTINNIWNKNGGRTGLANVHYPPRPFETIPFLEGETRPVLIDEDLHLPCYNVEELRHDPAVTVEWAWGKRSFGNKTIGDPWSATSEVNQLYASPRIAGWAIWAGIDDVFLLPDGKSAGYGPWGIIDGWRRLKPEHWDTKMMYAPIWVPVRCVQAPQKTVRVPIENRYAFTHLDEVTLKWELAGKSSEMKGPSLAPGERGELEIPLPEGVAQGELLALHFYDTWGRLIVSWGVRLGDTPQTTAPQTVAGMPRWKREQDRIAVTGSNFRFSLDTKTLAFSDDSTVILRTFPRLSVSQLEKKTPFWPNAQPYAELPDVASRKIDAVNVKETPSGLEITVQDRYPDFSGWTRWTVDAQGAGSFEYDYHYESNAKKLVREAGLLTLVKKGEETVEWDRKATWEIYPAGHLGRASGKAFAHRAGYGMNGISSPTESRWDYTLQKPQWDWTLDENAFGTRDFRSSKLSIRKAVLSGPSGGVRFNANADASFRCCLDPEGVRAYFLVNDPAPLSKGDHLHGLFLVSFFPGL